MNMQGWIKTHRKIIDWEWFTFPNAFHVFSYLIIIAQRESTLWQGIKLERGSAITSIKQISFGTGVSEMSVRTCLKKLKQSGDINIQTTHKFSIVTICNFDKYQADYEGDDYNANTQLTNKQRTTNKRNNAQSKEIEKSPNNINNNPYKDKEKNQEEEKLTLTPTGQGYNEIDILEFENFNNWLDTNFPNIRKMKEQLTIGQYINIRDKYGKQLMIEGCNRMENWNGLVKNCKSVNLTLQERIRSIIEKQNKLNGNGTQFYRNGVDAFGHDIAAQQERIDIYRKMQEDILSGRTKNDDPYFNITD